MLCLGSPLQFDFYQVNIIRLGMFNLHPLLENRDQNNRISIDFCYFKKLRSPSVIFHTILLNGEQHLTDFC